MKILNLYVIHNKDIQIQQISSYTYLLQLIVICKNYNILRIILQLY